MHRPNLARQLLTKHAVQADAPVMLLNLPPWHASQIDRPVVPAKLPGGQPGQDTARGCTCAVEIAHGVQAEAPVPL